MGYPSDNNGQTAIVLFQREMLSQNWKVGGGIACCSVAYKGRNGARGGGQSNRVGSALIKGDEMLPLIKEKHETFSKAIMIPTFFKCFSVCTTTVAGIINL
jgi:hypothetical protein